MPWTATFAANFEPFDRQLDQASASLGQFEQDTKKVERSLQRMVSEFDGTKVSQQAQLMAAAVDKIGGAAKLTEAEQRKLNATVTEAMAKYRSLKVEAPASVQKLSRELQDAAKSGGVLTNALGGIKTAALGAFAGFSAANLVAGAIGGIKQMASSALETAGKLTDLSAQTGVMASSLDRLRLAAAPAGVEIEQVADTVSELSKRLTGGDASVTSGLRKLNLDLNTLKASGPDGAFIAIVEGLGKIPDPMERSRVAFELFGDKGKEVLKLVSAEFVDAARNANGWSEETIAALDNTGDALDRFGKDVETVLGKAIALGYKTAESFREGGAAWLGLMGALPAPIASGLQSLALGSSLGQYRRTTDISLSTPGPEMVEGVTNFQETLREWDRAAEKAKALREEQEAGYRAADEHYARLKRESVALHEFSMMAAAAAQAMDSMNRTRAGQSMTITGRDISSLTNQVSLFGFPSASTQNGVARLGTGPSINWSQLSQQVVGAFSGGNVGGGLGSIAGGLGGTLLASGMGFAAGSMMGSVIPVVGTVLGGMLGKYVGGLFGPSRNARLTQQSNANIAQTQAGLLQQYGSVQNIAGMGSAGDALAAAWGSKGQAGEQWFNQLVAAFERQNQLLDEQTAKQATLNDLTAQRAALEQSLVPTAATVTGLMQQYGIEIEGAGQKVQQLVTTADFEKLINDMQTLERAGIDTGGMLSGMADEISNVVQRSIKFGTEIPANMRPYIESLAKAGRLTDENGEAITDLSQIKFGAPVETEAEKITKAMDKITDAMQPVVDRLKEIADLLARGIPAAAQAGADGVDAAFRDAPTGSGSEDSRGYAAGDVVYGTRRAWIGEGGQPEIVGPVSFMARALAGAMAMQGGMAFAGAGFDARVAVPLYLHERELGRAIIDVTPKAARWAGVRLPRS